MVFPSAPLVARCPAGASVRGGSVSSGAAPPKLENGSVLLRVRLPSTEERSIRRQPIIRACSHASAVIARNGESVTRCEPALSVALSVRRLITSWNLRAAAVHVTGTFEFILLPCVNTLTHGSKKQRNKNCCHPFSIGLTNLLPHKPNF